MKSIKNITSQVRVVPALVAAAWLLQAGVAHAESDTFCTGKGRSGALSVGAANTVVNTYAPVTSDVAAGARTLPVGAATGAASTFAVGDMVMIWQVGGLAQSEAPSGAGASLDLGSVAGGAVGRYELARVKSFDGTDVTLTKDTIYSYAAGVTQLVLVPEYTTVSIAAAGGVTAPAWNGSVGGIVAFLATGAVTNDGVVSVAGKGFRGGVVLSNSGHSGCTALDGLSSAGGGARKGEGGVTGVSTAGAASALNSGRGNRGPGGGGGNCHNAGGGGGGNFGPGGAGGNSYDGNRAVGGSGGAALVFSTSDHLMLGGGGGAGDDNNARGSSGGAGGGVLFLRAASASGGQYLADGLFVGGTGAGDGQGGGGAGGTLAVAVTGALDCATMSANGGKGGNVGSGHGGGGGGGGGRIATFGTGGACVTSSTAGAAGAGGNTGATGTGTTGSTPPEPAIVVTPCDYGRGTCGGCTGAADCATLTGVPFCRAADAKCVSCLADSDCGGGTPWCDVGVGTCRARLANGSALPVDTAHTSPVLDGVCSGPAAVLTCSSGVCDTRDNQCGYANAGASVCTVASAGTVCRSGACSASASVCVPAGGCAADTDCNTASEWCNVSTLSCVQKSTNGTALPSDGAHGAPVLDGSCTVAAATLTCASGACDTRDNQCGYGNGAGSSCSAANAAAVCRSGLCSTSGTCIAPASCAADGDCAGGWCNLSTATCAGKTPNGETMASDPAHTTPLLDGACSGAAATLTCASGVCDSADNRCGLADGTAGCTAATAAQICRTGNCKSSGVCGKDPVGADAGAQRNDASAPGGDAAAPRSDASVALADAGGNGGTGTGAPGSDASTGSSGATGGASASADSGGCSTQGGTGSTSTWALLTVAALGLIKRRRAA